MGFYYVFSYLVFGILRLLCKDFLYIYAPFSGIIFLIIS